MSSPIWCVLSEKCEKRRVKATRLGDWKRKLSASVYIYIFEQWCGSPPDRYRASASVSLCVHMCAFVFTCVELGLLTFAVSQTAVVAHRAEVLEYEHSYC